MNRKETFEFIVKLNMIYHQNNFWYMIHFSDILDFGCMIFYFILISGLFKMIKALLPLINLFIVNSNKEQK